MSAPEWVYSFEQCAEMVRARSDAALIEDARLMVKTMNREMMKQNFAAVLAEIADRLEKTTKRKPR